MIFVSIVVLKIMLKISSFQIREMDGVERVPTSRRIGITFFLENNLEERRIIECLAIYSEYRCFCL